jgi:rhodanese-related sulfurtransferase
VRNPDEFDDVRIEGPVIVPLPDFTTRFAELPTDRPLYLVCRSGNRSAAAAAFLLRNGYEDVANVVGGMMAWEQAGLAVVRGPAAPGEGDLPGS